MSALADNTLTVSSAEGHPGDVVDVTLSLANTDAVVAAEIKIPLTNYTQYVDGSATLSSARSNDHSISASSADGMLSIYVYGFGNAPLKGNSGELCTFRLKLGKEPAAYSLNPTVLLSSASGQSLTSSTSTGTVTLLAPKLTITTPEIDYGHVPIRSTYTKSLTLHNSGTEPLTISNITFDAAELSAAENSFTIAAGSSKSVTISYAPIRYGRISHTATVTSNAVNGAQKSTIIADPYSVNELRVVNTSGVSDTEATVSLTLKNMEPITAGQISFTMPDGLAYVDGSVATAERASALGASVALSGKQLTLFFYSQENAVIEEGNGDILTFRVRLVGKSGYYYLTPKDVILSNRKTMNMVSATSQGYVQIQSPTINCNSSLSLPKTPVTNTAEKSFSISNNGQIDLIVNNVTFLAEGYSIKEELPITIARNTSKNITVCFAPEKEGNYRTTMNIYSNDPAARLKAVTISSEIYEPNNLSLAGAWTNRNANYRLDVALDNYTSIVGAQMDVHLPSGVSQENVGSAFSTSNRLQGMMTSCIALGGGVYRVVMYSINNTPITSNSGNLFSLLLDVNNIEQIEGQTLLIDNIVLSNANGTNYASSSMNSLVVDEAPELPTLIGDVNGDGKVTMADAVATMDYYLHWTAASSADAPYDINQDGKITMADAVEVMNIYLTTK